MMNKNVKFLIQMAKAGDDTAEQKLFDLGYEWDGESFVNFNDKSSTPTTYKKGCGFHAVGENLSAGEAAEITNWLETNLEKLMS